MTNGLSMPAEGVRHVPRRAPAAGSSMPFCSEIWSSAELNKKLHEGFLIQKIWQILKYFIESFDQA